MPLLRRAKFERAPVPENLDDNEDVFYCSLTGEIFRDYDEFFKRTILLNSLVWTCSATGKNGLTYEEALNSENAAQDTLEMMPDFLERPMLYITNFTERGRLDDMVADVVNFMKERYFVGEVVEVVHNGVKRFGTVIEVNYDPDVKKAKDGQQVNGTSPNSNHVDNDRERLDETGATSISSTENAVPASPSTNTAPKTDDYGPAPECFKYVIEILRNKREEKQILSPDRRSDGLMKRMAVYKHDGIIRRKVVLTKTKCRLFLKNSCDLKDNRYFIVKPTIREQYDLDEIQWDNFFAGPKPQFLKTPLLRKPYGRSTSPSYTGMPPSSSKSTKRHRGSSPSTSNKHQIGQSHSSAPAKSTNASQKLKKALDDEQQAKMLIAWEKQQQIIGVLITEAQSLRLAIHPVVVNSINAQPGTLVKENLLNDMRLQLKKAKEDEKERIREERRKARELMLEWKRPRDDLECDDHKPMPEFLPVTFPDFLSDSDFGECLVLLEFLNSFNEQLTNFQETFPDGVTLSYLWDALMSHDPRGPYAQLLIYLLGQVFQKQTEEDGDEVNLENKEEIPQEGDLDNKYFRSYIEESTLFSEVSRNSHGVSVRFLPLDGYTLTEVLRMYFMSGGYYTGIMTSKFRLHRRGGFKCWDDHALLFRLHNQDIMVALSKDSVFSLNISAKLKLLTVLCDQLLTYSSFRNPLTETAERLIAARMELRQLQLLEQKWDKDAIIAKYTMQNLNTSVDKSTDCSSSLLTNANETTTSTPKQQQANSHNLSKSSNSAETETPPPSEIFLSISKIFYKDSSKREDMLKASFEKLNYAQLSCVKEIDDVRRMQKEFVLSLENRLKTEIHQLQSCLGYCLLGQDRLYRKYLLVPCVKAVFIERDYSCDLCECENATPLTKVDPAFIEGFRGDEKLVRKKLKICTGVQNDCPVHCGGTIENGSSRWSLLSNNADALNDLIACLNRRGFRENELCENLTFYRDYLIDEIFKQCDVNFFTTNNQHKIPKNESSLDFNAFESAFREYLLEIEYKIYAGGLGNLNISNRDSWRDAIDQNGYEPQCKNLVLKEDETVSLIDDCSAGEDNKIKQMRFALLQVANSVAPKYLKFPFCPQSADSNTTVGSEDNPPAPVVGTFYLWKKSLLTSMSWSQLFLHMETFEKAVSWNMSLLQVRCRECRRKGDVNSLVVCCNCDRPFHVLCLKPSSRKLVSQLGSDWACNDCRREEKAKTRIDLLATNDLYDAEMSSEENSAVETKEEPPCSSPSCTSCQKTLWKQARLTCATCSNRYHYQCANATKVANKKMWRCNTCSEEATPSGRSSDAEGSNNSASVKLSRTGRLVKRPISFEDMEFTKKPIESTKNLSRTSSTNSYLNGSQEEVEDGGSFDEPSMKKARKGRFSYERKGDTNKCDQILKMAIRHSDAWPFLKPVSRRDAPDYYVHIKRPMDLQTIRSKLDNGKYDNEFDFVTDLRQIFENCRLYNEPYCPVYKCGENLEKFLNDKLYELNFNFDMLIKPKNENSAADSAANVTI